MSDETMKKGLQAWGQGSRIVLTVTPDGRVVPGEGLQMDDVAREFLAACGLQAATLAENARLRERVAALEYLCERFDRLATDLAKAIPAGLRRHLTVVQLRALQEQGQQLMVERAALAQVDERGAE